MANVVFGENSVLVTVAQLLKRTESGFVPVVLTKDSMSIKVFNSARTVFVSITLCRPYFGSYECTQVPLVFSLNSSFFCDLILKVCPLGSELTMKIAHDVIEFSFMTKGNQFVTSIPLRIIEERQYEDIPTESLSTLVLNSSTFIKSVKLVSGLDQPTTSFKLNKKHQTFDIVGSGNSVYKNSVQSFSSEGVTVGKGQTISFDTKTLEDYATVSPLLDYVTLQFDTHHSPQMRYHSSLFDVAIVISTVEN